MQFEKEGQEFLLTILLEFGLPQAGVSSGGSNLVLYLPELEIVWITILKL